MSRNARGAWLAGPARGQGGGNRDPCGAHVNDGFVAEDMVPGVCLRWPELVPGVPGPPARAKGAVRAAAALDHHPVFIRSGHATSRFCGAA
jgi:hypothetical protein